ncbi:MAG: DUF2970 domain-containing protein [Paucibacter sp.]|nr:DUF2970 domain-containing protein [Roseateles sp.]
MASTEPGEDIAEAARRPLSFWQTIRAVAWSFIGLRRGSGYEEDVKRLNPVHVIVAGVLAAALFVVVLLLLVQWVVGSGVAKS